MAKTITFTYGGKDYTLEFTRKSIETMERQGFVATDIDIKPMSTIPALFSGAFLAHHPFVKKETTDSIFSNLKNKGELIQRLAEMYNEPLEALVSEPEDSEGNLDWGMN